MKKLLLLPFYLLLVAIFVSCEKDEVNPDSSKANILKVNKFIWEVMDEVYLWQAEMTRDIDINNEVDPYKYFKKLLYHEDKWSFITDDVQGLLDSFKGKEKTFGYSLTFGQFSGTQSYFAIVEYVNPNTPASEAGLRRGDLIVKINNKEITQSNYMDLFSGSTISITKGMHVNGAIGLGETITMTSKLLTINPILLHKTIEVDGKKVGYIIYNHFILDFNTQLTSIFQEFKDQQVSDVVVDLRYNPGGDVEAAIHLSSILAPQSAVSTPAILIKNLWNQFYQNYWIQNNKTEYLQSTFDKNVAVNMDLSRVYFLTSEGSASASELTISGLMPYMEVITIGQTTSGKYTASTTFQPTINNKGDLDPDIKNWAIQPIIFKYANAAGLTDFKEGLAPNHAVEEVLVAETVPQLGDVDEPLLAKAIELITGKTNKSAQIGKQLEWKQFDRRSSKYEKQKQVLLVPNPFEK